MHVCTKNQLVFEIWILKAYTGAYVFLKLFIQSFKFKKRVTACATKSILEVMLKKLLQLKYISFNYVFQSVRQCHLDQSFQIDIFVLPSLLQNPWVRKSALKVKKCCCHSEVWWWNVTRICFQVKGLTYRSLKIINSLVFILFMLPSV